MKLFTRRGDVTPFLLLSSIAGRRWGGYVIEGSVGILHRQFEDHWSAIAEVGSDGIELTASLHLANIREMSELCYIDPREPLETQVYPWCESAVAILATFPTTHAELSAVYKQKRLLAGHPLDHFLVPLPQKAEKNIAFRKFLERAS
jgi:hypothetical protein